jgi:hypothetical protein
VVVAEHGSEVGGAGGEHGTVARELAALHADDHVGEEAAVAELVEHLQDGLRVDGATVEVEGVLTVQCFGVHLKDLRGMIRRHKRLLNGNSEKFGIYKYLSHYITESNTNRERDLKIRSTAGLFGITLRFTAGESLVSDSSLFSLLPRINTMLATLTQTSYWS